MSDVMRPLVDFSRLSWYDWHPRYFKPCVLTDGHWEIASGKVAMLWEELLPMPINEIFGERQHQSSGLPPFLMELEGDRSFNMLGGNGNIIDVRGYKIVDHRRGKEVGGALSAAER